MERFPDEEFVETRSGSELVGWAYHAPFEDLEAGADTEHRVIPWEEVTMDQGTGVVHIAPGAGTEDFELAAVHGLAVLTPVDGAGRFYPQYGWLAGMSTTKPAIRSSTPSRRRGLLVESGEYVHAYPHCWRCDTPLIFRVADDWYISVAEIRQPLKDANAEVAWTPEYMGKLMDDWLNNMGDWNISRRRYYGLPLPIYRCECGEVTVIGSRAELEAKATAGLDQLEELRRPWIDRVTIRCDRCGNPELRRIEEVGDVWLDAGIVPFSTLGWQSPNWVEEGNATGAARGLTRRRPARPRVLGEVVPRRLGVGDARAGEAVVLLPALHVGGPGRDLTVPLGARLREDAGGGRSGDARLLGQPHRGGGGVRAHGRRRHAMDVLRPSA